MMAKITITIKKEDLEKLQALSRRSVKSAVQNAVRKDYAVAQAEWHLFKSMGVPISARAWLILAWAKMLEDGEFDESESG